MKRTITLIVTELLAAVILLALWPRQVMAQEPPGPCMSNTSAITATYNFSSQSYSTEFSDIDSSELWDWRNNYPNFKGSPWTPGDCTLPGYTAIYKDNPRGFKWYLAVCTNDSFRKAGGLKTLFTVTSPITGTQSQIVWDVDPVEENNRNVDMVMICSSGVYTESLWTSQFVTRDVPYGDTCSAAFVDAGASANEIAVNGVSITCGAGEYPQGQQPCSTVDNANFSDESVWLLDGTAVITNGVLSLADGDISAQNLTLTANQTYNAVIYVTQVTASTDLTIYLGQDNETMTIDTTGWYTATFTTPSNLGGSIAYILENSGNQVGIDFTCVSLVTQGGIGETGECIAPSNGTFDSANDWTWYRGAQWFQPGNFALLPVADLGLVATTQPYTMPQLGTGEHLILSLTAMGDGGAFSVQAIGDSDYIAINATTYANEYQFEFDADSLAGEELTDFSIVNPSDVITGLVSTADIHVDNVCFWIADRPPFLPTPIDPDGISPIDIGVNYISCDDVDGLLASIGVNIRQYRAEYAAGASVWDPIGWVPWLIAAGWVILDSYLCIFMGAFVTLVDLLEFILNNGLNIANWLRRSGINLFAFLVDLWRYGSASLQNGWAWWLAALSLIITWFLLSGGNFSTMMGTLTAHLVNGGYDWLNFLTVTLPQNILPRLFNGLRVVINWLIDGWNLIWPIVGQTISSLFDVMISIWNNSILPVLQSVWNFLTSTPLVGLSLGGLLLSLILSMFSLAWTVLYWLWQNIFMLAYLPIQFYYAWDAGIQSNSFAYLLNCDSQNFWCALLAGIQLLNQVSAHTLVYPVTIVGIIVGTIMIIWKYLWALFSIEMQ